MPNPAGLIIRALISGQASISMPAQILPKNVFGKSTLGKNSSGKNLCNI